MLKKGISGKTFKQLNEHALSKTGPNRKESGEDTTDSLKSSGIQIFRQPKVTLSKRKVNGRQIDDFSKERNAANAASALMQTHITIEGDERDFNDSASSRSFGRRITWRGDKNLIVS